MKTFCSLRHHGGGWKSSPEWEKVSVTHTTNQGLRTSVHTELPHTHKGKTERIKKWARGWDLALHTEDVQMANKRT